MWRGLHDVVGSYGRKGICIGPKLLGKRKRKQQQGPRTRVRNRLRRADLCLCACLHCGWGVTLGIEGMRKWMFFKGRTCHAVLAREHCCCSYMSRHKIDAVSTKLPRLIWLMVDPTSAMGTLRLHSSAILEQHDRS